MLIIIMKMKMKVCDIIDKLLAKNAEDRYQSAEGLLSDLRCCMQGLCSPENTNYPKHGAGGM